MFLKDQPKKNINQYTSLLQAVGSLSKLFSDSSTPYLFYRVAENAFCRAFIADNLSRSDTSADARKANLGIGLKTFLDTKSGSSYQKIAEFNRNRHLYQQLENKDHSLLVSTVAEMRNERIASTLAIHGLKSIIYHNVVRNENVFAIHEENMDSIDVKKIQNVEKKRNSIYFTDGKNEYNFNLSKSTLLKKFTLKKETEFAVDILDDPFEAIEKIFSNNKANLAPEAKYMGKIYLPLYSERGDRHVPEHSGLNQWNAAGRVRKSREAYIPVPSWIHREFPGFLPKRETAFELALPNGKVILASVCQEGGKAIMSNPNTDLGTWLLDDVLRVGENEIVTIDMLDELGIDSVEIRKTSELKFEMDFKKTGRYEAFRDFYSRF